MSRNLVSIRTITNIYPIPGADSIETVLVQGWRVVVKKGQFSPGDKALYFEIDSLLPEEDERFKFLFSRTKGIEVDGKRYARLRTIRLRGQISQGLLLPLDVPPQQYNETLLELSPKVILFEPPAIFQSGGDVLGNFPFFIKKTDQERIQNMPEVLNDMSKWEVTTKLDGTSCTVYYHNGHVGVCSRNLEMVVSENNSLCKSAIDTGLLKALETMGLNMAVQGEFMGPKVQGNNENLPSHEFFIFDVWNIDEQKHLSPSERDQFLTSLTLHNAIVKEVPKLGTIYLSQFNSVEDILEYSNGPSLNPNAAREGLVFKRVDGQLSFKVISNDYLLGEK